MTPTTLSEVTTRVKFKVTLDLFHYQVFCILDNSNYSYLLLRLIREYLIIYISPLT
jgi:hypothetical protein